VIVSHYDWKWALKTVDRGALFAPGALVTDVIYGGLGIVLFFGCVVSDAAPLVLWSVSSTSSVD